MTSISLTDSAPDIAPVAAGERIQALDVVRGFALIGIFLMNVEFYNRPLSEIGMGLPTTMTGMDWFAGWFIYTFVQGKFWTMFSLLFGMGFAVMLTRAERAERNFLRPYLRRIAALAVFGALHHILIWGGDILFSYAVGACGLLILLYGNWVDVLFSFIVLVLLGSVSGVDALLQAGAGLGLIGIAALFLRWERKLPPPWPSVPVISAILVAAGAATSIAALVAWFVPAMADWRVALTIIGPAVVVLGFASAKFHAPVELRGRRLGVAMYLFPFFMVAAFGVGQVLAPPKPAVAKATVAAASEAAAEKNKDEAARRERREEIETERHLLESGSYADNVRMRANEFVGHVANDAGFAVIVIGMFFIGSWFVRSGVMENTGAHLPLFRKLALFALPLGVGIGLLATQIATGASPAAERDPYQIAVGLTLMGNLPACLGYVSVLVLMLNSRSILKRIAVLAPLGRMALTNYLTHSVLGTLFFYGYGLGHYGTGRAMQVVFVAVVILAQLLFCTWWLKYFRYGPMEWLWRCITYRRISPIRRELAFAGEGRQVSA